MAQCYTEVTKWTRFYDLHGNGTKKEDFQILYIEANEDIAIRVFYSRFGHNPMRVTCTCCGEDYSIRMTDNIFDGEEDALTIHASDITEKDLKREVPRQGFVWVD